MKAYVAIVAALFSLHISAKPSVGDQVVYTVKPIDSTIPGLATPSTLTREITAYDSATETFTVTTTSEVGNIRHLETDKIRASEMPDPQLLLDSCESDVIAGEYEELNLTVGTMMSCKLTSDSLTYYTGTVPFGLLKWSMEIDGKIAQEGEVTSFKYGP